MLCDKWYDFKVWLNAKFHKGGEKKIGKNTNKIRDLIFFSCFLAIPLIMFLLKNVVINGNAIILAFQKYENGKKVFAGFEHFKSLINSFIHDPVFSGMLGRSFLVYFVTTVIGTIIPTIFSYYVYKKLFGWKIFKVILFIPSILSSIITVSMFTMVANEVIPEILKTTFGVKIDPLLTSPFTMFNTLLFYTVWMGLGSGLLTQLAAMNTVDPSVTESALLEGIGFFQELWHIVLPACYQVLTLGLVTGIATIFTNNMNLYAFYGENAPDNAVIVGYYFQVETLQAEMTEYPYLSAWGVMITLIVTPLTLLLRHLINKYGPSEDGYDRKKKA